MGSGKPAPDIAAANNYGGFDPKLANSLDLLGNVRDNRWRNSFLTARFS
jgi:hypothetical protein